MGRGSCKKKYPKDFQEETTMGTDGYPSYRRPQVQPAQLCGKQVDNRDVVPFNKHLLLKYNCHINVEACGSVKAVKYIYKYIYKGHDVADVLIRVNDGSSASFAQHDEIKQYVNGRYVSAPEAMWRLLENKMHDRSHSVIKLAVHSPMQHLVYFKEGKEAQALAAAAGKKTMLTAWFELNARDPFACTLLYSEIPYHYVWRPSTSSWEPRRRGAHSVIPRMYAVHPKAGERFYLRLLLLHVRGPKNFADVRTFNGITYPTFKEAAAARSLLEDDTEWERCLQEAAATNMPRQLRQLFTFICVFCNPQSPLTLWTTFKESLAEDFLNRLRPENSITDEEKQNRACNESLFHVESLLQTHGYSCESLGLPKPTGESVQSIVVNKPEPNVVQHRIASLNTQQKKAFDLIMEAVAEEGAAAHPRCFYIDGPGGSGKTYLYNTLMASVQSKGHVAAAFATTGITLFYHTDVSQKKVYLPFSITHTGIAAQLLSNGRTVHSGFRLPVPTIDTSTSAMCLRSVEANNLRNAQLIVIDEASMLTKHGLRCIDNILRDITQVKDVPFGGKTIVLGGDFRQTLPVIPRAGKTSILEATIKFSPLWAHFHTITLIDNMRTGKEQHNFNSWLLQVGDGTLDSGSIQVPEDAIEIPSSLLATQPIVQQIYGSVINTSDTAELSKRVILAAKNEIVTALNAEIIQLLPGPEKIYLSADSIEQQDEANAIHCNLEFLNSQQPSGLPPHRLHLKVSLR